MLKILRWSYLLGPIGDSRNCFSILSGILWNVCTEEAALNGGRSQEGNKNSHAFKSKVRNVSLFSAKAFWSSCTLPEADTLLTNL